MSLVSIRPILLGFVCAAGVLAAEQPRPTKRVPAPKEPLERPLPAEARKRLDVIDAAVKDPKSDLRQLHAQAVKRFIDSGGFGFERMPALFGKQEWKTDDLEREPKGLNAAELEKVHLVGVLGLALGLPLPELKVTADRPHPVRRLLVQPSPYYVRQVSLVGLVVHDEPTVYHTPEGLKSRPVMVQTRAIDDFEAAGLDRLRGGEDLFIRQRTDRELRMLGAIRAADACLKCHDGHRGDLLGAFSYTLLKTR